MDTTTTYDNCTCIRFFINMNYDIFIRYGKSLKVKKGCDNQQINDEFLISSFDRSSQDLCIGLARNDTPGCAFHQYWVCNPMFCNIPNVKIGKNRVWFLEIGCAKHTLHPWLANALDLCLLQNHDLPVILTTCNWN